MSEEPAVVTGPPTSLAAGIVKAVRPRQWVKNVLVLAAPVAAGTATESDVLLPVALAFVVFCMAASGIYLVNDAMDVEADRAHPTKRFRPIAAGVLPVNLAFGMAVVLLGGSIALSFLANWQLAVVMAVYIGIQLAYCFGLKHQAVLDICIVSSGFLLRAIAGGVAAEIALSQWFLLVMAFGSLFMRPVSGTPNCSSRSAPARRSASPSRTTPRRTCVSSGRSAPPRSCSATDCGRSSRTT